MTRPSLDIGFGRHALALLLAGCASAPATQQAYIAPTSETITSEAEQGGGGDRPVAVIYVTNRSTVPIIVWGLQLIQCENVKQRCEPRTVNIKVNAGGRTMVQRVEPENLQRNWTYRFHFSWRADSSYRTAATRALADAGDADAQLRLTAIQRADSLRRMGPGYRELSRDEHVALASRVAMIRAEPESLVLAPGARVNLDGVRILLVDDQGNLLGRTRWTRYRLSAQGAAQFVPSPGGVAVVGLRPGKASITYALAEEFLSLIAKPMPEIDLPVVVRYVFDEHAPVFAGTVADADTKAPLRCARVALEDSAQNVVNQTRSDATGAFTLPAPRVGTYRIRVELNGWSPFLGQNESGAADEKRSATYPVRFAEQVTSFRPVMEDPDEQRVRLTGAASPSTAPGAPPGQNMRLGGSATLPILEIISARIPPSSSWVQFAVDDAGRIDTASVVLPSGFAPNARAAVMRAVPQLRFSAAREGGKSTCDLTRLSVTFTPR